jgi:DNA-binding beta-propeller fold protein YncE
MKTFGQGGSGEGEVKDPRGLAVDSNQLVYVANTGNDRIEVFKKDGSFVKQIGIGQLQRPENVTVKDDCVCVADTSNHRICIFQKGRLAQTVGTRGSGPGQFMNPSAVAFSPDGDMFVTDHKNCRVQVFSSKGQYLREFGGDQLRGPQHIIITSNEEVFIADWGSGHVAIFNTSGDLLHRLYVPCPYGLAVDDNRGLLVTDYDKVHVYN